MATRVIDDTKLQDIAVAIQSKDNGGQMTVDEMAGRIEAIPTGSDFDTTVTANQVKMIIEVFDFDLSFWTRFGLDGGGTVTVDWGDNTTDAYTNDATILDYAPQRKHNYQNAGKYLVTLTVSNGTLIIGSVQGYSTLSEGEISGYYNYNDPVRKMYNNKVKELSFGENITVVNLLRIPYLVIHNDITFSLTGTGTNRVVIKSGVTAIGEYWLYEVTAVSVKIPSSVTSIANFAFANSGIKIIDFTDIRLNENDELPITFSSTNIFNNTSASMILLFATQEIAEVAKVTTNLSAHASKIKYVGEV